MKKLHEFTVSKEEEVDETIVTKDDKGQRKVWDCTLREADSAAAARWRSHSISCAVLGDNGKPKELRNAGSSEPLLVHLCLIDNSTGVNVPQNVIQRWPERNPRAGAQSKALVLLVVQFGIVHGLFPAGQGHCLGVVMSS